MTQQRRIRVLPRTLVNRIAAGEIVERPASVVKELVENALDAGARRIRVKIEGGGLQKISVVDDGSGIDPRDMLLAVQSHATSKLEGEDDLWAIPTFGFRGEALASIASVSRLEIRSRTADAMEGARLVAEGDVLEGATPWTGPQGTTVEVSDLFFNTPVRLRNIGSPGTEATHVATRVRELALGNPAVSFRLISGGKESIFSSGSGDLAQAVAEVFDAEFAGKLLPLYPGETNAIMSGLVGPPDLSRARRDRQFFLLNGRAITHPAFSAVLDRAYEGFAPTGRHPVAIVILNVRPDRVDVNVHPTKRRVRFHDERELTGRLYRGVQGALLSMKVSRWDIPGGQGREDDAREFHPGAVLAEEQVAYGFARDDEKIRVDRVFENLEPLGQVLNTFIVARGPGGLYLVDQHAACERLYYDVALEASERPDPPAQRLAAPAIVELDGRTMELWRLWGDVISEMGFEVEPFGPGAVAVRSVPILAGEPAPAGLLLEILERLGEGASSTPSSTRAAAALAACRASVKAGEALGPAEIRGLIARMAALRAPGVCPHGRPTVIRIDRTDIDRLFRRA